MIYAREQSLAVRSCYELDCDCRRTIIHVVSETTGDKVWATISYGWESPEFYGRWMGDPSMVDQINGAFLDQISPQTKYSNEFLEYFQYMIEADKAYAERIQQHYWMFKTSLKMGSHVQSLPGAATRWTPPRKGKFRKR